MLYILLISIIGAVHGAVSIGEIHEIRFAPDSSMVGGNLDGVLEINFNGDVVESSKSSRLHPVLNNVNCDGRINLDGAYDDTNVHLGLCDYTPVDEAGCHTQVAVLCTEERTISRTVTTNPDNCSVAEATVRVVDGSEKTGRLEIQHPTTGEWGTICADGFDVYAARAACRMLCTSDINMEHAYPVLYKYPPANVSVPIHLANIVCPIGANSLYECDLTGGFGATAECTHAMDVGLNCGPPANVTDQSAYTPELECNQTTAILRYSKTENPDLNATMINLYGEMPNTCQFYVRENAESFDAIIPLEGCRGNVSSSNDSTIAITMQVIRYYLTGDDGVVTKLPSITEVVCFIDRTGDPESDSSFIFSDPDKNSVNKQANISVQLGLFRNSNFTDKVAGSVSLRPGRPVFVLVSVEGSLKRTKLILNNCWATALPNRTAELRKELIINRCVAHDGLAVIPQTPTRVGFTFPAFYIGTPGSLVPTNPSLYVHCTTILCDTRESGCSQFCKSPIAVRKVSADVADLGMQSTWVFIKPGSLSLEQEVVDGEE